MEHSSRLQPRHQYNRESINSVLILCSRGASTLENLAAACGLCLLLWPVVGRSFSSVV
jgi:hypothetical protein